MGRVNIPLHVRQWMLKAHIYSSIQQGVFCEKIIFNTSNWLQFILRRRRKRSDAGN